MVTMSINELCHLMHTITCALYRNTRHITARRTHNCNTCNKFTITQVSVYTHIHTKANLHTYQLHTHFFFLLYTPAGGVYFGWADFMTFVQEQGMALMSPTAVDETLTEYLNFLLLKGLSCTRGPPSWLRGSGSTKTMAAAAASSSRGAIGR